VSVMVPPPREPRARAERASRKKRRAANEPDGTLLGELKQVRRRLATDLGVPAYVVFNDATLIDMAAKCPRTGAEMLDVSGVGQSKLTRYGDEFLAAIEAFIDKEGGR